MNTLIRSVPACILAVLALSGAIHAAAQGGRIVAWGDNFQGQTNVPASLTNVMAVAAYGKVSMALRTNGTVAAWGFNLYGHTNVPAGLSNVVAISVGSGHATALKGDGRVVAWGGSGATTESVTNVPSGLTGVSAIAAGGNQSLALLSNGTVVAWGESSGTNVPAGLSNVVAIAAGQWHGLALKGNGRVVAWGEDQGGQTQVPDGLEDVVAIRVYENRNHALRGDGTFVTWPASDPLFDTPPSSATNVVSFTAGVSHRVALKSNGTLVAWGDSMEGQTNIPSATTGIVAVAAGEFHSLALKSPAGLPFITIQPFHRSIVRGESVRFRVYAAGPGSLSYQWRSNGVNLSGATAASYTLNSAQSNHLGSYSVVVNNSAGSVTSAPASLTFEAPALAIPTTAVFAVGQPVAMQLAANFAATNYAVSGLPAGWAVTPGTGIISGTGVVAPGRYLLSVVASNASNIATGSIAVIISPVAVWGGSYSGQNQVPAETTNAVAIAVGNGHVMALRGDGRVVVWGDNSLGQLDVPADLTNAMSIVAGGWHCLALRSNGTVTAWGSSYSGQTSVPEGVSNITAITADAQGGTTGNGISMALRTDGTVAGWGIDYGQISYLSRLSGVRGISTGPSHSLAVLDDGRAVAWGDGYDGKTNVPVNATGVVAVAAGYGHSVALRQDGSAIAWGFHYGTPSGGGVAAISAGIGYTLELLNNGTVSGWGYTGSLYPPETPPAWLQNVKAVSAGGYTAAALIAPDEKPNITVQPQSRSYSTGQVASLAVLVSSPTAVTYQWLHNGSVIAGASSNSHGITNAQPSHAGSYRVIVSNSIGSVTSMVASLTQRLTVPRFSPARHPQNGQFQLVVEGPVGSNYVVEATTNLGGSTNWMPVVTNVVPASGIIQMFDPISGQLRRFYRVRGQ